MSILSFSELDLELCRDNYNGQSDLLYAVASSGGLYRGTQRPNRQTLEQWDCFLAMAFATDLRIATRQAARYANRLANSGRCGVTVREAKRNAKRLAMFSQRVENEISEKFSNVEIEG